MRTVLFLALISLVMGTATFAADKPNEEQKKAIGELAKLVEAQKTGMSSSQVRAVCKQVIMGKTPDKGYEGLDIKVKDGKPESQKYKWGQLELESDGKIGFIGPVVNGQLAYMPKGSKSIKANSKYLAVLFFNYNTETKAYVPGFVLADKDSSDDVATYTRKNDTKDGFAYVFVP